MVGGEIFVPKIPSMNIMDLAKVIAPECKTKFTGIRPGEKLHEVLIPRDEMRRTVEYKNMYVVCPDEPTWKNSKLKSGKLVKEEFEYASNTNDWWLKQDELKARIVD